MLVPNPEVAAGRLPSAVIDQAAPMMLGPKVFVPLVIRMGPERSERVSVSSAGLQGNGPSGSVYDEWALATTADGRFIVFTSEATNLAGQGGGLFIRDMLAGTTSCAIPASDGSRCVGAQHPSLSADGRYLTFTSAEAGLVPGDTNGTQDVFLLDRLSQRVERVSVNSNGDQIVRASMFGSVSDDGRYVTFGSTVTNLSADCSSGPETMNVYVRDRQTGQTICASAGIDGIRGNGDSWQAVISGNGLFVTYASLATNLVPGDLPDSFTAWYDIFLFNLQSRQTIKVTDIPTNTATAFSHSERPSISADGRFVAFASSRSNLVPDDTNERQDIFVYDSQTDETALVSLASDSKQANENCSGPFISSDGRYVAFSSYASTVVQGDTNLGRDIFVRDTVAGTTRRASVASGGFQADDDSGVFSVMSDDGRYVVFSSEASNLVPGDSNGQIDVFRTNLRP